MYALKHEVNFAEPHIYMVKTWFSGVYIISVFLWMSDIFEGNFVLILI